VARQCVRDVHLHGCLLERCSTHAGLICAGIVRKCWDLVVYHSLSHAQSTGRYLMLLASLPGYGFY
jgi:hypothetical protein